MTALFHALLFSAIAAASGGPPPAEFESLEITYRLDGSLRLIETRSGSVIFHQTPATGIISGFVAPRLNSAGQLLTCQLTLVAPDGAETALTAPVKTTGAMLFWEAPGIRGGERLRFHVEQSLDLHGAPPEAWWFYDPAVFPFPVKKGKLEVHAPAGIVTVLDTDGYTGSSAWHRWDLKSVLPSNRAPRFALSSFRSHREAALWLARICPLSDDSEILERYRQGSWSPEELADNLAGRFSVRLSGQRPAQIACRPLKVILGEGTASVFEAQAALAAVFRSAGYEAERAVAIRLSSEAPVPAAFRGAWVRVRNGDQWLWFDAGRLGWGMPDPAVERLVSLEDGAPIDVRDLIAHSEAVATVEGFLDLRGELNASYRLTAAGSAAQLFCSARSRQEMSERGSKLIGEILSYGPLSSEPVFTDHCNSKHSIDLAVQLRVPRFLPPVKRLVESSMYLLESFPDTKDLGEDSAWIGQPGVHREEIIIEAPGYALPEGGRVEQDCGAVHFLGSVEIRQNVLRVARVWTVRKPIIDAALKTELARCLASPKQHMDRRFKIRRLDDSSIPSWVDSSPLFEANSLAGEALANLQSATARLLLERAIKVKPDDPEAWNSLGHAYANEGRLEDAKRAFQKQIELSPESPSAYSDLARIYGLQGYWDDTRKLYAKQLEIKPEDPNATRNLAMALTRLKDWPAAEAAWAKAATMFPGTPDYRLAETIAKICHEKISASKALAPIWAKFSRPEMKNTAAYGLAECGKELRLAENYAREAVKQAEEKMQGQHTNLAEAFAAQTSLAAALDTLGWIFWKQGKPKQALAPLTTSATLHPSGIVLSHLAQVQWKLGMTSEAISTWRRALHAMPGLAAELPPEAAARVQEEPRDGRDEVWDQTAQIEFPTPPGRTPYGVLFVNPDGGIRRAWAINLPGDMAEEVDRALRTVRLPQARALSGPVPYVTVFKLEPDSDGRASVYRSLAMKAVTIIWALAPDEFPRRGPGASAGK